MERSYWTYGSRFLCIRTDVEGKANPSYERVAQAPEVLPGDDPQYSKTGDWCVRAEQIAQAMNTRDDLVAALSAAIGRMMNVKIDLETGVSKAKAGAALASAIKTAEDALVVAKAGAQ